MAKISEELADVLHVIADHLGSREVHEKVNAITTDEKQEDQDD